MAPGASMRGAMAAGCPCRPAPAILSFCQARWAAGGAAKEEAMPVLKVRDLAFARLRAPDLDAAEEFLDHFGMIKVERTPTALYYRGTEPAHHIHITEKAESPSFAGLAYELAVGDDLKRAAKLPGASGIETIDEPGGGKRVRLTEPNGYTIELVHGIARHER